MKPEGRPDGSRGGSRAGACGARCRRAGTGHERCRQRPAAVVALGLSVTYAAIASASPPVTPTAPSTSAGASPERERPEDAPNSASAHAPAGEGAASTTGPAPGWETGRPRSFAAATIDVGYLYLRPRLSLGYGKPFRLWTGLDVNPIATNSGIGGYAGLRGQIPWFDLRAGARGFHAFQHTFLPPEAHYRTVDLNLATGAPATYVTLEAELSGGIPAGPGSVLVVLTASAVLGVAAGRYVYEETLRVITDPPAIYRGRLGYALRVGPEGAGRVGLVGEVLDLPKRSAAVFRAGLVASFTIDEHLEALALLVVPIVSPDTIGIAGGDYGELGLRYRWATR